jgi:hypothetical protein
MEGLRIAAWAAFGIDAALVALLALFGIIATGSVERSTMFAMAGAAIVPLAVVFAILWTSSRRGSLTGLWICVVLCTVPLILLLYIVAQQNFL